MDWSEVQSSTGGSDSPQARSQEQQSGSGWPAPRSVADGMSSATATATATAGAKAGLPDRPGPLVIAHRGSSDNFAEHTAAAYRQAIADGADGLECDVRLTADGVLVCMHDRRIDRTSDGQGIVSAKTYSELADWDYSSWKSERPTRLTESSLPATQPPQPENALTAGNGKSTSGSDSRAPSSTSDYAGEAPDTPAGLLRLNDLIDIALSTGRRVNLSIETKHPVRFGGLVEDRVISLLRRRGLIGESSPLLVRMMSFSEVALRRIRTLAPGLPTVLLMDRVPMRCRSGWLPYGARIAGPSIEIIRAHPHYVDRVHSAGSTVHVWVVNDPEDISLCLRLGVDAIITNRPGMALRQIKKEVQTPPTGDATASGHG